MRFLQITQGEVYMENFDLNLYKVFCYVAENKNISKAAEELFVSRQAISYNIKQLETALGGKLFFRTQKGVVLTPEAEELYQHIKQSFDVISIGERIFKENCELLHGTIHIGCNPELFENCLYQKVEKFYKLYPNIKINIISKPIRDLLKMFEEHKLDMIIRKKFWSKVTYPNFSIKMFDVVHNCFFCNKDFKKLAERKNVSLEELSKLPLLLLNRESNEREFVEEHFREKEIELQTIMEFSYHDPLILLVKLGYGIGYTLKETITKELEKQELFVVPVKEIPNDLEIGALYDENYLSCVAKKFIEML